MKIYLKKKELLEYFLKQINTFFQDKNLIKEKEIKKSFEISLEKIIYCFSHIKNEYYFDSKEKNVLFNYLNTDHYATFLYFLSRTSFKLNKNKKIAEKIYYLNKILHSVDIFYEVKLPNIFLLVHPVGTIVGRANYDDFLTIYQGVNIGSNKNKYPSFSKYVTLRPSSSILGNCEIGENAEIAAGSLIIDKKLKKNHVYFGTPKNFEVKMKKKNNKIWIR